MGGETDSPSPDAVRDALRRILDAPEFAASERNRSFLKHVVEETLEGRGPRIKAYTIATSVFGRDPSFDAQLDSIVRIEAGRLRRSLEHYYLTAGSRDLVRITLPRGRYVPGFGFAAPEEHPPSPPTGRAGDTQRCTILVAPFEEDGGPSPLPNFARGLTRQVITALTGFTDLWILGSESLPEQERGAPSDACLERLGVDFLLTGGVTLTQESFALEAMLLDARTRRYVWAEHFQRRFIPADILDLRDEVANNIASTLAQPYGIIFSNKARDMAGRAPTLLASYGGVLRFYQYHRTLDANLFPAILRDLEQVIRADPLYAEAFACLSLMYSDGHRLRYAVPDPATDPRQRAVALAHRAIELAPNSSRAHHALGQALWFSGDIAGALAALEAGRGLNPNDTELLAELGLRLANLGRWEEAVPLLERAFARNPAQPGTYRVALAQYHYVHGRYEEALVEARKINAPTVIYGHLLIAAAAAQLGRRPEAEEGLRRVLELDPRYGDRIVSDLLDRHIHEGTIRAVLEGLRKAGLTGREMEGRSLAQGGLAQGGAGGIGRAAPPGPVLVSQ
jgi:TolB-like protein